MTSPLAAEVAAEYVLEAGLFGRGDRAADNATRARLADVAIDVARRHDDDRVLATALVARCSSVAATPEVQRRLTWFAEAERAARRAGDVVRLDLVTATLVREHLLLGDIVGASAAAERHDALADQTRHPRVLWFAHLRRAALLQMRNALDASLVEVGAMYELGQRFQLPDNEGGLASVAFFDLYHRGQLATARGMVEQQVASAPQNPLWWLGAALAQLADGDDAAAARSLDHVTGDLDAVPRNEFWLAVLCLASEVAARLDHHPEVRRRLHAELLPWAGQFAVVGRMIATLGPVDRYLALLEEADGADGTLTRERALVLSRRVGADAWTRRVVGDAGR